MSLGRLNIFLPVMRINAGTEIGRRHGMNGIDRKKTVHSGRKLFFGQMENIIEWKGIPFGS